MDNFWEFAGNYWWLIFIVGGPIAAGLSSVGKATRKGWRQSLRSRERRAEIALERDRIRYGAQATIEAEQSEGVESTKRVMAEHDAVNRRWLEIELDPVQLLELPQLADLSDAETARFHRAKRAADLLRPTSPEALTDRESRREYREAVQELAHSFDAALAHAQLLKQSEFGPQERARLASAVKLLNLALDAGASPPERQQAYRRAQKEISGLIVLPTATTAKVEDEVLRQIER